MSTTTLFIPGQRVVNEAEPKLGLGQVFECDRRNVTVEFAAVDERRVYRIEGAPLRRFRLTAGQKARSKDGSIFVVTEVQESNGLLVYLGEGRRLDETDLGHEAPRAGALEHLESLNLGPFADFELRQRAWDLKGRWAAHTGRGLLGPRVDLLSHQMFVASKSLARSPVRALLADEVGLGKTIEAGLIASGLAAVEEAETMVVVVPEPLKHQWLAEFYRRFNLTLEIYEPESAAPQMRVLASYEELEELSEFSWELAIVDEAHHLAESADLERLARNCQNLLLLSATPARSGPDGWWHLCRLVDPGRYGERDRFLKMHGQLEDLSQLARKLEAGEIGPQAAADAFPQDQFLAEILEGGGGVEEVLDHLVDRHGTGRVLIRNRRPRLEGLFPGRKLVAQPVEDKFGWLLEYLGNDPSKTLLIVSEQRTVVQLYEAIKAQLPITMATFHEGMSLLERDRQAAYFADPEGAVILLASEIGSEGRNFQFASDLILYDLPESPDLLEQRIGRLDRIGQRQLVKLHYPYLAGSSEEQMLLWHQALGSFEGPVPGSQRLCDRFAGQLEKGNLDFETVHQAADEERRRAEKEVDVLVDRNSFRPELGDALIGEIEAWDHDQLLRDFVPDMMDRFGVIAEELDKGIYQIKPGDMMFVDSLPGLPNESGVMGTFERQRALIREDLEFLSVEHPVIGGTLDMLLDQPESRASAARWRPAPETTVALQFLFVIEAVGPARLHLARYLPPQPATATISLDGRVRPDLEGALEPRKLQKLAPEVTAELLARLGGKLRALAEAGRAAAMETFQELRQDALDKARMDLARELDRKKRLAELNPELDGGELEQAQRRALELVEHLQQAEPRLDAVRLLLCQQG